MLLLTVNAGSTSVKLAAFDASPGAPPRRLARVSHSGGALQPAEAIRDILGRLGGALPDVVVHRVVHGGTELTHPTVLDAATEARIAALGELAPLHNPVALRWIAAARSVCGAQALQVAAFDTAFFAALPRVATEYALPPEAGVDQGVRRYGFHGLAHEAMWRRWCELHPDLERGGRLLTLQLGGGCSITAVRDGRPVDTSMGFSPLEGLVMATRSGDLDPAALPHLRRRLHLADEAVLELLNRRSGLLGVSGRSSSIGELLKSEDGRARFAVDLYCYRARKYVGAYLAVLGGCDGIVFGGGVGEHVPEVRHRILQGLEWAGIVLDRTANERAREGEAVVSAASSAVSVVAVAADEELVLVRAGLECSRPAPASAE